MTLTQTKRLSASGWVCNMTGYSKFFWWCLFLCFFLSFLSCEKTPQTFIPPNGEGNWILVDNIHSIKQNPSLRLRRNDYSYQGMHGYYRLFTHLEKNGYPYSQIQFTKNERITPEILKGFSILFINLVSDDRPDFTSAELTAITEFVEKGGGLFVIADHTNVYHHAERISPLLQPMGVDIDYSTVIEGDFEHAVGGGAWTKFRSFELHPVTDGVRVISFQTGGALLTDFGVAFSSPSSFVDFWDATEETPGFYGNWGQDSTEPSGPFPVVAAAEFGQGRLVVVGDQNIFGDEWLFIGQNFELACNAFQWLAGEEDILEPPLRSIPLDSLLKVGFDLEHCNWNIGLENCDGFFPFFINFNRTEEVSARGLDQLTEGYDVLIFTDPVKSFIEEDYSIIKNHLSQGGTVMVLTNVIDGGRAGWELIENFIPDFSVQVGELSLSVSELPAGYSVIEKFVSPNPYPVFSDYIEVEGYRIAGHKYPVDAECPKDIEDSESTIIKVTTDSGEALLYAEADGERVDIARMFTVEGGTFIVFIQDGFFRNETLGWERQMPTTANIQVHQVEYRLIDWLIDRHSLNGSK